MRRSLQVVSLSVAAALGCSSPSSSPAPAALDVVMTKAVDINPDPNVVEVSLVAEPGLFAFLDDVPTPVWGYRDASVEGSSVTVPGPLVEANVGDTVIVHFSNGLEEGTTVHHHGPRIPNDMDGAPMGDGMVLPGKSFDYEFVLEDASTFWYHPHWRTDEQIERGLYGQLVVHGERFDDVRERFFMLDDIDLASDGTMVLEPDELDKLLGRRGDTLLVNGRPVPTISVEAASRERWHLTNASNGRYYQLSLPGHVFNVVGTDGGLLEEPYQTSDLLIAPAERYDVIVDLNGDVGATLELVTSYVARGMGEPEEPDQAVMRLRIDSKSSDPLASLESVLPAGAITPITTDASTTVRDFELGFDPTPLAGNAPAFMIDDERFPFGPEVDGTVGDVEIWAITNATPGPEPFHLHGTFFQVIDRDGIPAERLALKDVVNVAAGTTLRFAVRYERQGKWMFHSHIPEHAERGMMRILNLQ